ncbi:MAG: MFS transporter [Thermodesulfobacteriota bacterium]
MENPRGGFRQKSISEIGKTGWERIGSPSPDSPVDARPGGFDFRRTLFQVSSLLISLGLLILGNGLQTTLLGVRAGIEGIPPETVGLMMSAFFTGYLIGCRFIPKLVSQVGHVRAFAALTSLVSTIALLHALFPNPWVWIVLRVLHGCFFAGLILIVESWLNGCTEKRYRGRVLAIYGIVYFAAWSASQLLLNLAPPSGFVLFCLVSILLSVALVPVTVSRAKVPGMTAAAKLSLKSLYRVSPLGMTGVLVSGLCMSAFFGMGPTFGQAIELDHASLSVFMFATYFGGLTFQWPIGWLSDHIDRGAVIALSSLVNCLVCFGFVYIPAPAPEVLWVLSFLFGGFGIPVYSVCVAHTNDQLTRDALLAAASGLLFVYGLGSAVSPFAAGILMGNLGPEGLFLFAGIIQIPFICFCAYRVLGRPPVVEKLRRSFVVLPRTTDALLHLDKRHQPGAEPARKEMLGPKR